MVIWGSQAPESYWSQWNQRQIRGRKLVRRNRSGLMVIDHLGGVEVILALRRLLLLRISRNRILE